MRYKTERILLGAALVFSVSLTAIEKSFAQAEIPLEEGLPVLSDNSSELVLPDNITLPAPQPAVMSEGAELFDAEPAISDDNSGFITPPVPEEVVVEKEIDYVIENNSPAPAPKPVSINIGEDMGDEFLREIDNDLFQKMTEIEKQTALLNLELRRERIKSEIEAVKAQRRKAEEEEALLAEEKELKRIEKEQEQKRKALEDERKLIEAQATLERVRQGEIIKAYKESMFEENNAWIEANSKFYKELAEFEKERDENLNDISSKIKSVLVAVGGFEDKVKDEKDRLKKEKENLQTQVTTLMLKVSAAEEEKDAKTNPFANMAPGGAADNDTKLSNEYAVMEIRGQGDELVAKLMNADGQSFLIRKGTVLQSGHIIDEIERTYIRADKNGIKDYIYFSAGGILEKEPVKSNVTESIKEILGVQTQSSSRTAPAKPARVIQTTQGLPSLGDDMVVK